MMTNDESNPDDQEDDPDSAIQMLLVSLIEYLHTNLIKTFYYFAESS